MNPTDFAQHVTTVTLSFVMVVAVALLGFALLKEISR